MLWGFFGIGSGRACWVLGVSLVLGCKIDPDEMVLLTLSQKVPRLCCIMRLCLAECSASHT